VQVFGRRDDETDHRALKRPATKKRQGTKSRAVGSSWQQALLGSHVGAALDVRAPPQHRTMGVSADTQRASTGGSVD